jgi:hypothetical protein
MSRSFPPANNSEFGLHVPFERVDRHAKRPGRLGARDGEAVRRRVTLAPDCRCRESRHLVSFAISLYP